MNRATRTAIAYCQNALSFLFIDKESEHINQVYLFGSAARGDIEKDSDIDLFIDTGSEPIEGIAKAAVQRFYHSRDFDRWKLSRFTPPISIQAGRLSQWQLQSSIAAEGLLLYSKDGHLPKGNRQVIIVLKLPSNKNKYLKLTRLLFGRSEAGYKDKGIVCKLNGKKLGSNVFMIPKDNQLKIMNVLNQEKADYQMKEAIFF